MKKAKIIFWVTTIIIVLFEGVMPLLTFNSEMSKEGITGLGYPLYFGTMLVVFKVLGSLILAIPKIPKNIKEWAYAGFGIDFISAFVSLWVVTGFTKMLLLPVVFMVILSLSYANYHKLNGTKLCLCCFGCCNCEKKCNSKKTCVSDSCDDNCKCNKKEHLAM